MKFSKAMNRFGIIAPNRIISDGKMHVCRVKDCLSGSRKGWYIFVTGKLSVGLYGYCETKRYRIWRSKPRQKMTTEEDADYLDKLYMMREERKRAQKKYFAPNSCAEIKFNNFANNDSVQNQQNHVNELTESSATSFNIAEFVKKCREQKMDDSRIAHELMKYYGKSKEYSIPNTYKAPVRQ